MLVFSFEFVKSRLNKLKKPFFLTVPKMLPSHLSENTRIMVCKTITLLNVFFYKLRVFDHPAEETSNWQGLWNMSVHKHDSKVGH